jgi:hypothetical protein
MGGGSERDQRRHSVSERRRCRGVKRDSGELGKEVAKEGRVRRGLQSDDRVRVEGELDNDRCDHY